MGSPGFTSRIVSAVAAWAGPVAAMLLLLSCAAPTPPMQAPPPPKPMVSYVNVPVTIPLATVEKSIDDQVPRAYKVEPFQTPLNGGSAAPACGSDVGYSIERGPISLAGADKAIVSNAELSYWLKGRKQVPCPGQELIASCGTDGEAPRTASIGIDTRMEILPDLSANVQSTLRPAAPGNRCVMRPVGVDVTDTLMSAFNVTLRQMLPELDRRMAAALDLKSRMQAAWARMSEPREIQSGIWLAWNPEGVGVVPITVADGALHTGIQLRVRPVIGAGGKPAVNPRPLPLAYSATPDDAFRLQLPVDVKQTFVQARLDRALEIDKGGMPLSMGNYQVRITKADISAEGTQVLIMLNFSGDFSGTAHLTGTPVYDAASRALTFPDLEYALDSDQFLLKSASNLAHAQIRDRLRQQFTIELGERIDQVKGGLEDLLNRKNGNVQLRGSVDDLRLLGVSMRTGSDIFTAFLDARGKVSAELHAAGG